MLAGRPSGSTAVTDRAPEEIASRLLGRPYAALDSTAQNVALHVAQQRHIARDVSFEVNLEAEVEIMLLYDKLDALRHAQRQDLLALQAEQLRLLVAPARSPAPQDGVAGS